MTAWTENIREYEVLIRVAWWEFSDNVAAETNYILQPTKVEKQWGIETENLSGPSLLVLALALMAS